jgi:hypothetical protein
MLLIFVFVLVEKGKYLTCAEFSIENVLERVESQVSGRGKISWELVG